MLKNKAIKSFSECNTIYGRDLECDKIKEFLNSSEPILHITGSPGTGKTATVKWILSCESFLYFNYFNESKINLKQIKESKANVVVIDEFDKFLEEKKSECLKTINCIRFSKKKLITISNNLKMGNVRFKPYSSSDIERILNEKINLEIGCKIMDQKCVLFLAKKYEKSGDLRLLFKAIMTAIARNDTVKALDKVAMNDINESLKDGSSDYLIKITDFINTEKRSEQSIHHEMIVKTKNVTLSTSASYQQYLIECEDLSIIPLSKTDFNTIFEFS